MTNAGPEYGQDQNDRRDDQDQGFDNQDQNQSFDSQGQGQDQDRDQDFGNQERSEEARAVPDSTVRSFEDDDQQNPVD